MFLFNGDKRRLPKEQKVLTAEIGISQSYFSKIINRKKRCSKVTAYAIVKAIGSENEISDFFERVD